MGLNPVGASECFPRAFFVTSCLSCFTAAKISFTSTVSYYAHNYHSLSLSLSHYHYHCK